MGVLLYVFIFWIQHMKLGKPECWKKLLWVLWTQRYEKEHYYSDTKSLINNNLLLEGCSVTSGLQGSISLESYTCGGKEENIPFIASFKNIPNYFEGEYRTLKVAAGGQNTGKIYKHKCIINVNLRTSNLFGIFSWIWVLRLIRRMPSPLQHT